VNESGTNAYAGYLQDAYGQRPPTYYLQFVRTPLRSGDAVLDWGCGLGGLLHALSTSGTPLRLFGADIIDQTLDSLRERHPDWDLRRIDPHPPVLPWADATFDRIFLLDVIEHAQAPMDLLAEAHRLLKPGGILTLSTPDRLAFYKRPGGILASIGFNIRRLLGREWIDPTHLTEYTVGGLRRILAKSPFTDADFHPSSWHRTLWARPPRKHYSFLLELRKALAP